MSRPLYGGCPLFGGSVIRGFTVHYTIYNTVCSLLVPPTKQPTKSWSGWSGFGRCHRLFGTPEAKQYPSRKFAIFPDLEEVSKLPGGILFCLVDQAQNRDGQIFIKYLITCYWEGNGYC